VAAPVLARVHSASLGAGRDAAAAAPVDRSDAAGHSTAVLLAAARDGNQAAWDELVTRCSTVLSRAARTYRLSDADVADVVQVTWLRLVENLDQIRDPGGLTGWLVTTCRREALRVVRLNGRCTPHDAGDPAGAFSRLPNDDPLSDPMDVLLRDEESKILRSALARLPTRQERLLRELMTVQGGAQAYVHVAAALRMPVGSIGPTRQRALRRLHADRTLQAFRAGEAIDQRLPGGPVSPPIRVRGFVGIAMPRRPSGAVPALAPCPA
jgi:RNA polymerase sigma factor (sigma-70 family)